MALLVMGPAAAAASDEGIGAVSITGLATATGLVAILASRPRWPVAAIAVAVVVFAAGFPIAVWVGVVLATSTWMVGGGVENAWLGPAPKVVLPGVSLLALLAIVGTARGSFIATLLPLLALCMLITASWFHPAGFESAVGRFGSAVATLVGHVSFGILWLPLVLLPWAVSTAACVDPLGARDRWDDRRSRRSEPTRPWSDVHPAISMPKRLRRSAVALVLLGLAVGAAFYPSGADEPPVPAAFEGRVWYPEYLEDINWVWSTSVAFDPLSPIRVRDVTTRHVNVQEGHRITWEPPCPDCEPLLVWMYGGSTTFGLGQRDEHTVPSELARASWKAGIPIRVVNRGQPGDAHWEEAQRLGWDLANEPAPDLIVFYDGVNEMRSLEFVTDGPARPVSFIKENFWQQYLGLLGEDGRSVAESLVGRRPGGTPPGAELPAQPSPLRLEDREWGRLAAERYERSRETSAALAAHHGVPTVYFWQPALEHRSAGRGEPTLPGREFAEARAAAASDALSVEVIDVSGALDDVSEPVFYDSNHTNELGARVVAEELFGHLAVTLERLGAAARSDGA